MENKDFLTEQIIGCCFKVHKELGPGFPEKIYHKALIISLKGKNLEYNSEEIVDVLYNKKKVGNFRVDLIVQSKVIVELKALTGNIPAIFEYQLISYLRASGLKVGLLVNFGNKSCQIKRVIY